MADTDTDTGTGTGTEGYEREAALRAYHHLYIHHPHSGSCYYCGLEDEVDDHVPPLAAIHRLRGFTKGLDLVLVRSCAACNATLGDMPLMSPEARREYIQTVALPRRVLDLRAQLQAAELNLQRLRSQLSALEVSAGSLSQPGEPVQFKHLSVGADFRRVSDPRIHEKTSPDTFRVGRWTAAADPGEWVVPLAATQLSE